MKSGNSDLAKGFFAGVPIMIGYFFVAIGVGVYAGKNGMTPFQATLMSAANLTSAGEISAISVFGDGGDYLQLVVAQIVINIRYALMAISLSQKRFSMDFNRRCRFLAAYGITDEIFAVLANEKGLITPKSVVLLILGPIVGWTAGTFVGAFAGEVVSSDVSAAMSILIHAMLISIIVPEARRSKPALFCVLLAALISTTLHFCANGIRPGYAVVISSVLSAALAAWIFPVKSQSGREGGASSDIESPAGERAEGGLA